MTANFKKLDPSDNWIKIVEVKGCSVTEGINDATPTIFNDVGVPLDTFSRIYKLVERDLLPAEITLRTHELTLEKEFGSYVCKQMVKGGLVGFGSESAHERKTIEMALKSAHLERNADLKTTQVAMQVNAMLAKYNLMSTVALVPMSNQSKPVQPN